MAEPAPGRGGVLVIGMHRSGTSVATQAITCLGLTPCLAADRLGAGAANPRGHWESRSLMYFNEVLLQRLGGAWWCPPPWSGLTTLAELQDEARERFSSVHRGARWVWKDPRNAVLLPFWRRALGRHRLAVVLMLRHPLDIVRSLHRRDRLSPEWSLALWERYLRAALSACSGLPVLVTAYDRLIADPAGWGEKLAQFVARSGLATLGPVDFEALDRCVDPSLRHSTRGWDGASDCESLGGTRDELLSIVRDLLGAHTSFLPPGLPAESAASTDLLARVSARGRNAQSFRPDPPGTATSERLAHPSRARQRVPSVSVIVTAGSEGGALGAWMENLRATIGDHVEVIVVDDGLLNADGPMQDGPAGTLLVRTEPGQARAEARRLGAAAARGEIIVFSDTDARLSSGWLPRLQTVLARRGVGAAGPAITPIGGSGTQGEEHCARAAIGQTFADRSLNLAWMATPGDDPAEVPLLAGCLLAIRRLVYRRIGGLDAAMPGSEYDAGELCLRLWRCGLACVGVPDAAVSHPSRNRLPADGGGAAALGRLRIAALHLGRAQLAEHVAAFLTARPEAAAALADLLGADVGAARARIRAMSIHEPDWFFERFQITTSRTAEGVDGYECVPG